MVKLLKKGSKIHIKKSHEGRFTEYCGGEVTDECILKGKRSPDPTTRRQATFAANARKFKHQQGGELGPTGNGYGGKGPMYNTNLYSDYTKALQLNISGLNQRIADKKAEEEAKLEAQRAKADEMANTITSVVGDTVINPIANKILENKIDNAYENAGLTDNERQAGYAAGKTDKLMYEEKQAKIASGEESSVSGATLSDNDFDENGMLKVSRNSMLMQKQYNFINQSWVPVKHHSGGILKTKKLLKTKCYG